MSRLAAAVGFSATIAFAFGAFLALAAGCGGPLARARPLVVSVERKLGGEIKDTSPGPCLRTMPTKTKISSLAEPEHLAYLDEHHEPRSAMRITVDSESMKAFLGYVASLEDVAKKALGCVTR